ncbi:DUF6461 domain-containing protein, partial [[Kitasatospora] papulosa]|uniref:DUF6461 domain-containing protein n=1 Tax=[Kitasatospora] papulosa TaxID=1464011 RepID=UPI0036B48D8C
MTKTGADYAWFENDFPDLAEAYCFTLVRGPAPDDVVSRLDGRKERSLHGIAAVVDVGGGRGARAGGGGPPRGGGGAGAGAGAVGGPRPPPARAGA